MPDLFTRVAGLPQRTRMLVTSWLACTMLLLTATFGYLLLRFPAINRALWAATVRQARRTAIDVAGLHYAAAALDVLSVMLTAASDKVAGMMREERLPVGGDLHAARGPAEQPYAEVLLRRGGAPGNGLLGKVELVGHRLELPRSAATTKVRAAARSTPRS